jgi:hypothetical protein
MQVAPHPAQSKIYLGWNTLPTPPYGLGSRLNNGPTEICAWLAYSIIYTSFRVIGLWAWYELGAALCPPLDLARGRVSRLGPGDVHFSLFRPQGSPKWAKVETSKIPGGADQKSAFEALQRCVSKEEETPPVA